jgi:hypothetical protein
MSAAQPSPEPSIRATLRHGAFRALLTGGTIYFVGNAMQAMAAAWLMVELTGSSFLAALVQTAVFLPMFLLALPAGVLADTTDRRRLILAALAVQAGVVALLALLVLAGWAGAATLLLLTFVAGCCTALLSPSWNSAIVDVVPRPNCRRPSPRWASPTTRPARWGRRLAGWCLCQPPAAAGSSCWRCWACWCCWSRCGCTRPARTRPAGCRPSGCGAACSAALRFARHSETVLAQLVRTVAYSAAGSALWALLPVIAQRQLGLGAAGFGC